MTTNDSNSNPPQPRLCHLRQWPDFPGYGFNLHSEKSKPGQFIGKVDANSPAGSAGLREGDRIIEVNSAPIGNENHKQVVQRIKEGVTRNGTKYPDEVILLVLDPVADQYYNSKSIIVTSSHANILKFETGSRYGEKKSGTPYSREMGYEVNSSYVNEKQANESSRSHNYANESTYLDTRKYKESDSPGSTRHTDLPYTIPNDPVTISPQSHSTSNKDKRTNTYQSSVGNGSTELPELHMSAAEFREKLKQRNAHKRDPRHKPMSMKEKHDLIDGL